MNISTILLVCKIFGYVLIFLSLFNLSERIERQLDYSIAAYEKLYRSYPIVRILYFGKECLLAVWIFAYRRKILNFFLALIASVFLYSIDRIELLIFPVILPPILIFDLFGFESTALQGTEALVGLSIFVLLTFLTFYFALSIIISILLLSSAFFCTVFFLFALTLRIVFHCVNLWPTGILGLIGILVTVIPDAISWFDIAPQFPIPPDRDCRFGYPH